MAAAMEVEQSIDPLEQKLQEIATGFQTIMDTSDTTDGRSKADKEKRVALVGLSNNFNLGCGMLAYVNSRNPRDVANRIASKTGSTIDDWYNEKVAMTGYAMYDINDGCKQQTRGGGKRTYQQKGGAMPDRYDVFTMILLGSSASLAVTKLAAAGFNSSLLVQASEYVIESVIKLAVKMGMFKAQCDLPSQEYWNMFKQYTVGNFLPVETCQQKIDYNDAQITLILAVLSVLSATLGGVTSYISRKHVTNGTSAVYRAVKENISKPVVDAIVRRVSESGAAVCSLAARGREAAIASYQRRSSLRSATSGSQSPPSSQLAEVQQAAEAQAQSEVQAIDELNEQIKNLISSGAITPEIIEQLKAQLNSGSVAESPATAAAAPPPSSLPPPQPPLLPVAPAAAAAPPPAAAAEPTAMDTTEGGRRRRKRATRKSRKVKKSKTMKRGRKGKSKRKAHKSKKSRKTRGGTSRARR